MTAQEQAKYFLRKLQYAKLFELLELNLNEENTDSKELFTLQDLKDRFVASDIDRRFPQQVRLFLKVLPNDVSTHFCSKAHAKIYFLSLRV